MRFLDVSRFVLAFVVFHLDWISAGVTELDDRFLDAKGNQPWLVEFYAPWCGHCKRLEPVYHQVWMELRQAGIGVGKLDATRYEFVARRFDVRGYPTIKFIQGEKSYTHRGDRSKEGIIEFARRANGPTVRPCPNLGKLRDIRNELEHQAFFLYVGDPDTELLSQFKTIAEKFATLTYFYSGKKQILPKEITVENDPAILVFKDGNYYEYEPPAPSDDEQTEAEGEQPADQNEEDLGEDVVEEEEELVEEETEEGDEEEEEKRVKPDKDLVKWINAERYTDLPKISGGGLNEMANINKRIVMIALEEKPKDPTDNKRFKEIAHYLATTKRQDFHQSFQFTLMEDQETINSITMSYLKFPTVVVLDPVTQLFYQPDLAFTEMNEETLEAFLHKVVAEEVEAFGGTGVMQKVKRLAYDIHSTVYSMWQQSGWLVLVVFGVPSFVISMICYALCCMEPFDDANEGKGEEDEEDEEDGMRDEELEEGEENDPLIPELEDSTIAKDGHIKSE